MTMTYRSPFKSLLLPSIITATTVFTLLTAMWTPRIVNRVIIRHSQIDNAAKVLPMAETDRNGAMRFVGIAIMLGTGVGLATFELIRRWNAFHDAPLIKAEQMGLLDTLEMPIDTTDGLLTHDFLDRFDQE